MLRKIKLLQSASMLLSHHYSKTTIGAYLMANIWSIVETLVLDQCWAYVCANNDMLPRTPLITQHWPNNCLLSGSASWFRRVCFDMRVDLLDFDQFTPEHLCEFLQSLSFLLLRAVKVQ